LIRAKQSTKIPQKREHLRLAEINTDYTIKGISAGLPTCPIRAPAQKTMEEIQTLKNAIRGLK
jgi:hypothetical protein